MASACLHRKPGVNQRLIELLNNMSIQSREETYILRRKVQLDESDQPVHVRGQK